MDKAALLGHPVKQSLSPQVYAALSRLLDREVKYKALDVAPEKLEDAVKKLREEEYAGFNATIPHKAAALKLASTATGEARAIGAANCVKIEGASLKAHNTDAAGFYDALSETGFKARDSRCQIFGAGGAARAVGYALGRAGARHVFIWARKEAKAEALCKDLAGHWPETVFAPGLGGPSGLFVNATPMGLEGYPEKFPVKKLEGCSVVMDLTYGRPTKFLELGNAARARSLGGLSMLVHQAIRNWEFWFGPVGGPGRAQLKSDVMRIKKWR